MQRETKIEGVRWVSLDSSLPIEVRGDLGCEREPLPREAP